MDVLSGMQQSKEKRGGAPEPSDSAAGGSFTQILGERGKEGCKYYKRKLLGTGSYGQAFLAEDAQTGEVVVAKIMDMSKMSNRDKEYAHSEIQCLANCAHPCIIKYFGDYQESDQILIVMEFADAGDLDRQIKARAQDNNHHFQEHEVMYIFIQLALALHYIHQNRMLHRDIKGANIFMCSTGVIKLADFGFSKQYEDTVSGAVALTFCGTPYYLAPELWNNKKYSKKADVWSLGVLLYEMLSLKRPFTAQNMKGLMQRVLSGEYTPIPSQYSKEVSDLVRSILTVDPNSRPSMAQIFQNPYVQTTAKKLADAVDKNSKISQEFKVTLRQCIEEAVSGQGLTDAPAGALGEVRTSVSFEGPVRKAASSGGGQWNDRYLILRNGELIICASKDDDAARAGGLRVKEILSVCPVPASAAKRENVFVLNVQNMKGMYLQALSKKELDAWIHYIQQAMGVA
eukprot:PhM_4_TR14873/c0_g1_i1/m.30110/K08857/NEK1_4_5; NIMA (never in mitosis gene a)-related kinase 1/4/5